MHLAENEVVGVHLAENEVVGAYLTEDEVVGAYLAENEVVGADDEKVTVELSLNLLLDLVVHVGGVVGGELVDDDLVGQLNLHTTDGFTHAPGLRMQ